MALDEKLVSDAIGKLKEALANSMKDRVSPLNDEEIQKIFNDNAEFVDKAQISEEEADEIVRITRKNHPVFNKEKFKEKMEKFEKKHLERLYTLDKMNEEKKKEQEEEIKNEKKQLSAAAQAAAGIVEQVVEDDAQVAEYDAKKKRFGRLYYYVWWLLDSEEDYQTLLNNPHSYPRNWGKLKVQYKEIGNKNIDEALAGEKSSGKIAGEFLGALGLVGRDMEFEDEVPRINLKPGQVIALGAARAKRWDWRTKEYRGLGEEKLMRIDPERLIWKWTRLGSSGEEKGTIKRNRGPVPKEAKKKTESEESIVKRIDKQIEPILKDLKKNPTETLKWHDKHKANELESIFDDLVKLHTLHPSLYNNAELQDKFNKTMDTLGKTIEAWKKNKMSVYSQRTLASLMKDIMWLEEAIKYLKKNPPKPA